MSRQILKQKYQEEIKEREQLKLKHSENLTSLKSLSHSKFQANIAESNKYKKSLKATILKLVIDKQRVLDVVKSLQDVNRKQLELNKIEGIVDDYIYMNIKLSNPSDYQHQIPVQIKLPYPLYSYKDDGKTDVLLIVKDKAEEFNEMIQDLDIATVKHVKTIEDIKTECKMKGNLLKKYLNQFDLIIMDDRINFGKIGKQLGSQDITMRKKLFPMSVKIANLDAQQVKKNIIEAFETVGLLLSGGSDFVIRCAQTESMKRKEIVKNVMQCAYKAVTLIFYSENKQKHNSVKEISLQTTQSLPLTIIDQSTLDNQKPLNQ